MKTLRFLVSTLFLFSLTISTQAQLGGLLKNQVKKAIQREVDKQVSNIEIQEQEESNERDRTANSQTNQSEALLQQQMMGMLGFGNVDYDMSYNFTSSVSLEIESFELEANENNKMIYNSYFDRNSKNVAAEFALFDKDRQATVTTRLIFDYKNKAMVMLTDDGNEKNGFAIGMSGDFDAMEYAESEDHTVYDDFDDNTDLDLIYKPTGRQKKILGYTCKEYVYEHPEGKIELWATKDLKYNYSQAFQQMGALQMMATGLGGFHWGTVLEMRVKDNESSHYSNLLVKEINQNKHISLDLSGYQMVGMSDGAR